jgi:hypothetical protein
MDQRGLRFIGTVLCDDLGCGKPVGGAVEPSSLFCRGLRGQVIGCRSGRLESNPAAGQFTFPAESA